ncbi:hypothetical protein CXF92_18685 [Pseudomonas sp. Choline-3u-10]|uniref:Uncharacterized protein n=1 Tax=viral metagenome TaxID=1070528 RepID=A0A6M3XA82_9ZZZZ|nr:MULTISPECIES: hypothetical protein [Pseudomonadaceae]MBK3797508.1 hypothetical protein [Stutzerimonas stutzeri]MBK3876347.1 hypothetical protein [Stutzerimonas stutzeri]PKG90940.1 hypothetical protein CXF92_18685 [Pseudomonas sp. Choline-3u-10]|tara:strand:- start:222 stop:734 length:513 start_codon:yes stop_codon:yes gene_type:complete
MSFTTYQILAFIGGFAGMAIVFGIGYLEGLRRRRNDIARIHANHGEQYDAWRHQLERVKHEHTLSRLNAAQAIEAMTEESDQRIDELVRLREQTANALAAVRTYSAVALTEDDAAHLTAIAAKLSLAAQTFANLNAHDQATSCRNLATVANGLFERYWNAQPALTQERVA